jgi:hypothetical protein
VLGTGSRISYTLCQSASLLLIIYICNLPLGTRCSRGPADFLMPTPICLLVLFSTVSYHLAPSTPKRLVPPPTHSTWWLRPIAFSLCSCRIAVHNYRHQVLNLLPALHLTGCICTHSVDPDVHTKGSVTWCSQDIGVKRTLAVGDVHCPH